MVNPKVLATFGTLSLRIDVHPNLYNETHVWLKGTSMWYCLKAESKSGETTVHIHWMQFFEKAELKPEALRGSREFSMWGPKRADKVKEHFLRNCPLVQKAIAQHGSKHSLQIQPLTSTMYYTYLQKEAGILSENMPDDFELLIPYLHMYEKDEDADKAILNDSKEFNLNEDYLKFNNGIKYAVTVHECTRFYKWRVNVACSLKAPTTNIDNWYKNRAQKLFERITGAVPPPLEEMEPPAKRVKVDDYMCKFCVGPLTLDSNSGLYNCEKCQLWYPYKFLLSFVANPP